MSDIGVIGTKILDPLSIFTEDPKARKARKRNKNKRKPRTFTSGDSLLSGAPGSATAGTLLGS